MSLSHLRYLQQAIVVSEEYYYIPERFSNGVLKWKANYFMQPRQRNHREHQEETDELNELFNKKFQFRFSNDWTLPSAQAWFSGPPWKVKELDELKTRLNFHKSQLNDFNIEEWSCHTRRRNPAGEVGWKVRSLINPEFLTQAWTKFYECACSYKIVPMEVITDNQMVSLHLCEAPGAFITSLNHYLKAHYAEINWQWVANTLNPYYEGNSLSNMISDDRFMFHTLDNWDFGMDSTGNLMDWNNSLAIVNKAKSLGKVLLVTADGSIDCLQRPDDQEEITSPLHYCEIITALRALSSGGSFIFKLFTMFEHSTVSLLYLINHLFKEVHIYKPVTSRQGNSEVYAVCLKYKGSELLEPYIQTLQSAYGTELYSNRSLFPLETIPNSFIKQIEECALYFSSIQCQVINNNIQAYFLHNNAVLYRDLKRVRAIVANEFIWRYNLKPLDMTQEILKGSLHEENVINTNPRYHRGSYTERQVYTKMTVKEKCKYLNTFLQAEDLPNSVVLESEQIRWMEHDDNLAVNLVFRYGQPLQKINSSKFIFVPIFKLYQQILAEDDFKKIILHDKTKIYTHSDTQSKSNIEFGSVLSLPEFDYISTYSDHDRECFKKIIVVLKGLSIGCSLLLENYNTLTHFSVSVLFILVKKTFEKTGFTSCGKIILNNMLNKSSLGCLENIWHECNKVRSERNLDVLSCLPVQMTNIGEFFETVVSYNNTLYRNKCAGYLAKIEKSV